MNRSRVGDSPNLEWMSVYALATDDVVQSPTKLVSTEDSQNQRRTGRAERVRRPFDEASEVEQEGRLYLILRRRVLGQHRSSGHQETEDRSQQTQRNGSQKC